MRKSLLAAVVGITTGRRLGPVALGAASVDSAAEAAKGAAVALAADAATAGFATQVDAKTGGFAAGACACAAADANSKVLAAMPIHNTALMDCGRGERGAVKRSAGCMRFILRRRLVWREALARFSRLRRRGEARQRAANRVAATEARMPP
jgi:hypothetical protein